MSSFAYSLSISLCCDPRRTPIAGAFSPPTTDAGKINAFKEWLETNKLPPHKAQIGAAPEHRLQSTEVIEAGEIMLSGASLGPLCAGVPEVLRVSFAVQLTVYLLQCHSSFLCRPRQQESLR